MNTPIDLPDVLEGHWTTAEGRQMADDYLSWPRDKLTKSDFSDFSLANAVFMAGRGDLDLIVYQTAAKERIRWLSAHLAASEAKALALLSRIEAAEGERERAGATLEEWRKAIANAALTGDPMCAVLRGERDDWERRATAAEARALSTEASLTQANAAREGVRVALEQAAMELDEAAALLHPTLPNCAMIFIKAAARARQALTALSGKQGDMASATAVAAGSASHDAAGETSCQSDGFQARVLPWMLECFGPVIPFNREERGDRLLEETFELLQSGGYDPARVLALRDYVWSRDVGEPAQEMGGVMVTLAAYGLAHNLDMAASGETELARIWTKVEAIRAKQAAKPTGSALPVAYPQALEGSAS
jgi:hypothetical protein